jgi:uncharacterized protein with HEPN domain
MKDELIPLHDILTEIAFLHSLCARSTFDSFKASAADVRAASYSIMVISEAVRRIPGDWLSAHPDVPWHAIRAIGNKLRHEYQRVSDVILWGIISSHGEILEAAVDRMLAERSGA